MGVSAGGLEALCAILKRLPERFGFALILVQHRSPDSDALCVVLTGATRDGARGLRHIVERCCAAMVQDPETSEVPVMPLAALQEVPEAGMVTLADLVPRLCEMAPAESATGVGP